MVINVTHTCTNTQLNGFIDVAKCIIIAVHIKQRFKAAAHRRLKVREIREEERGKKREIERITILSSSGVMRKL